MVVMLMAAKKKSNIYPVMRQFPLLISGTPDTNAIIRVDRALGAINHRLYRQSRMYTAKVDMDADAPSGTTVDVWALCDTWWLHKAYRLAFETFMENSKEERGQAGTSLGRWNDFRVDTGLGTAFQKDLLPSGNLVPTGTAQIFGTGTDTEYLMSEVHDSGGARRTFVFSGGTTATEYDVITEYDNTANTDETPSTPANLASYDGLTDEIDQGQKEHLTQDGNLPPYKANTLEGAVWIKVATLNVAAAGTQKLSTGFFKAPAGLIAVVSSTPLGDATLLNLEVKGGDYKGVHAPSMLDQKGGAVYASSSKSSSARHNVRIR